MFAVLVVLLIVLLFVIYQYSSQTVENFYTAYAQEESVRQYPPFTGNLPSI